MDMAIQHSVQQLTKLQEQAAQPTLEQVSPQDAAAFAKMTQAAPATAQTATPTVQAQQTAVAQASSSPVSAATAQDGHSLSISVSRANPSGATSATAASHNTASVEPVTVAPASTVNKAALSAPVASTEAAASPGDKILQSLERLGTDMNDSKTRIMEQAGTSTAGKMCQLQFEVAQFSTNQAILGQSGAKSSQGVQTLLKGQ